MSVLDTHVHLWNPNKSTVEMPEYYGAWLTDPNKSGLDSIKRKFSIDDYQSQIFNSHSNNSYIKNVKSAVYMECDPKDEYIDTETNFGLKLCKNPKTIIGGIIMKNDPNNKKSYFFEQINKYKNEKYLKGIRRVLHILPLNYCLNPLFLSNIKELGRYQYYTNNQQIVFDICCQPGQLSTEIFSLIKQTPDIIFIIDHCGGHHSIDNSSKNSFNCYNNWKKGIEMLSKLNNVYIKISGVGGAQIGALKSTNEWNFSSQIKTVDYVIKYFGQDKIIFGSDWPVCTLSAGKNAMKLWIDGLEKYITDKIENQEYNKNITNKLFFDNAKKVYKIDGVTARL